MDIGRRIKQRRIELGLTQDELGQRLGIKKAAICRLESEDDSFSIGRIVKIATALDTMPWYLTGWTNAGCDLTPEDDPDDRKAQLIKYFSELDEVGKDKLLTYAQDMCFLEKAKKELKNSES